MQHNHAHGHSHSPAAAGAAAENRAVCAVTGDIVDKKEAEQAGHMRQYNGKTYYFCCATCVQLFDKNPEKYAQKPGDIDSLVLLEKQQLADNIWSFRFRPGAPLSWTPGQFIRVELPHEHPDDEGTQRWFTIASTPYDGYVQITTRITGTTFKQALAALPVGGTLKVTGEPEGDFVWQEDDRPLVFVAGGIGITPYYSMLKARGHSGQPVTAMLVYNGRDDNLPFREELDNAAKRHPEFRIQYVIGERLTAESLAALIPELNLSQVYVSGPEPMVESLGAQLREAGLPEGNLHEDFFPNYNQTNY